MTRATFLIEKLSSNFSLGLYVSVLPVLSDFKSILKVVKKHFPNLDYVKDPHITILHSKSDIQESLARKAEKFSAESQITRSTYVEGAKVWTGHDKKGYFVLTLNSTNLKRINKIYRNFGYVEDYSEYSPHITLVSGIDFDETTPELKYKIKLLNLELRRSNLAIRFGRDILEPLKLD